MGGEIERRGSGTVIRVTDRLSSPFQRGRSRITNRGAGHPGVGRCRAGRSRRCRRHEGRAGSGQVLPRSRHPPRGRAGFLVVTAVAGVLTWLLVRRRRRPGLLGVRRVAHAESAISAPGVVHRCCGLRFDRAEPADHPVVLCTATIRVGAFGGAVSVSSDRSGGPGASGLGCRLRPTCGTAQLLDGQHIEEPRGQRRHQRAEELDVLGPDPTVAASPSSCRPPRPRSPTAAASPPT